MHKLLQSAWISRAWTFQELVLSKRPVFLCGNDSMAWDDLVNAVFVLDASDTMSRALAPWRPLAELWFNAPRRRWLNWRLEYRHGEWQDSVTFSELYHDFWHEIGPPSPQEEAIGRISLVVFLVVILIILVSLAVAWGQWVLVPFTVQLYILVLIFLWSSVPDVTLRFILFGDNQPWLFDDSSYKALVNSTNAMVNGIWTTLRNRECSKAHDKSFALSGILTRCGASPAHPDYSRSIQQTYEALFRDLLAWNQASLAMFLDAGIRNADVGWPSWVPNWEKLGHNAWLIDRYRLDGAENATPAESTQTASVSGGDMMLRGQAMGATISYAKFTGIRHMYDQQHLESELEALTRWASALKTNVPDMISYKDVEMAMFLVLHGLSPKRESTLYKVNRRRGRVTVKHPRWRAPYDASHQASKFLLHIKLLDAMFDPTLDRAGKMNCIRSEQLILDYVIDTVNNLVVEHRCLFVLSSGVAGSGPMDMALGDDVFLIPGARAPVALRRTGGRAGVFQLVGGVLVQGLMHGEMFEKQRLEELTLV